VKLYLEITTNNPTSINIHLKNINVFLNWCSDDSNNYISQKNYLNKYKQSENKKIKPAYTEAEYEQLLAYFQEKNIEMFLLIQFLWNTGARVGETLEIKLSDVILEKKRIFVTNKVHKGEQELLLLTNEAVRIVAKIVELANKRNDTKLFSWLEYNLPNRILRRAESYLKIKIEGRGLHGFRRAFTRRLIKSDISIPDIQDLLRHKSIETTMKHYNEYRPDELLEEINKKL
jgi:integrase/recombinase XerD